MKRNRSSSFRLLRATLPLDMQLHSHEDHPVAHFTLRTHAPESWLPSDEGTLAIDIDETHDEIIVRTPIAGVRQEDLSLSLHNDLLTIRGTRRDPTPQEERVTILRECHWGPFSRSVILPVHVRGDDATATLKDGVLTITLPKTARHGAIPVRHISSR